MEKHLSIEHVGKCIYKDNRTKEEIECIRLFIAGMSPMCTMRRLLTHSWPQSIQAQQLRSQERKKDWNNDRKIYTEIKAYTTEW